jgi:tRNA modification GTPase
MRAPYSYTREDVFEVHTIGSPPLLEIILAAFIQAGARLAQPGEFTRRAFLNGRLDLSRAESVMAIVRSRTDSELRAATQQLRGALAQAIRALRDDLSELCALAETAIDFSDQDVQVMSPPDMAGRLRGLAQRIERMERPAHRRAASEAVTVAIAGKPNVGKSSLLNALVERYGLTDGKPATGRRAIVSPIPGTTRDTLEARIRVQGVEFRLVDTAGLRETGDEVEAGAVQRARSAQDDAELILMVVDATDKQETRFLSETGFLVGGPPPPDMRARTIVVMNKVDLVKSRPHCAGEIHTSALTGEGVDALAQRMAEIVLTGAVDRSGATVVANARQQEALGRAQAAVAAAADHLEVNTGLELAALEMRAALNALGEIVGQVTTEDLLDRIFGQFCIGK